MERKIGLVLSLRLGECCDQAADVGARQARQEVEKETRADLCHIKTANKKQEKWTKTTKSELINRNVCVLFLYVYSTVCSLNTAKTEGFKRSSRIVT